MDIARLPDCVQRYFHFMGAVGKPAVWSFRLGFKGHFRLGPDKPWIRCEAWQYSSRPAITRIFHMRLRMAGFIPVLGRDSYAEGHGRMLIRAFDRFTLADGHGEAFDIGELTTYLNDAIMMAPSMLLDTNVSWQNIDANTFDVSLADHGRTVSARVFLDERGAPVNFSTMDRFLADGKAGSTPLRTRWSTPMAGWQEIGGRQLPTSGQAVWHVPEGDFAYADFALLPDSPAFNIAPGA
jgi:hypothetical protein